MRATKKIQWLLAALWLVSLVFLYLSVIKSWWWLSILHFVLFSLVVAALQPLLRRVSRKNQSPQALLQASSPQLLAQEIATLSDSLGVPGPAGSTQQDLSEKVRELRVLLRHRDERVKSEQARALRAERIAAWRNIAQVLAHEIKNPLTPIRTSVENASKAKVKAPEHFDRIFDDASQVILEEVERLRVLVDDFGDFARFPEPDFHQTKVSDLVGRVSRLYGRNLNSDVNVDPQATLVCDADQVQQALVNLIKNAREASDSVVKLVVEEQEDGFLFGIHDRGPGLGKAKIEDLLEPFHTTKAEGTGLGLAVVKRVVQDHGGRLDAGQSDLGGAFFCITLPKYQG